MTTESILLAYGFRQSGTCNCDGIRTLKYKMGNYQVNWRSGKGTFKLKQNGMTVIGWLPEKQLNEVLEKYIQKETEVLSG